MLLNHLLKLGVYVIQNVIITYIPNAADAHDKFKFYKFYEFI